MAEDKGVWGILISELQSEITPRDMADDLGYDKDETFRRYLVGQSYPSIEMCQKIGEFYGVDFFKLFQKVQEKKFRDTVK